MSISKLSIAMLAVLVLGFGACGREQPTEQLAKLSASQLETNKYLKQIAEAMKAQAEKPAAPAPVAAPTAKTATKEANASEAPAATVNADEYLLLLATIYDTDADTISTVKENAKSAADTCKIATLDVCIKPVKNVGFAVVSMQSGLDQKTAETEASCLTTAYKSFVDDGKYAVVAKPRYVKRRGKPSEFYIKPCLAGV